MKFTDDQEEDLLQPLPAGAVGQRIGYARVSTKGQLLDRQIAALTTAGCAKLFHDKLSGKDAERPRLRAALDYCREGDTLVVPALDRLGRSIQDLIDIVGALRKRGIGFTSLHESLDTTTPGGRLVFHVFAALAEFIRELIIQGTKEGLDAARARGVKLGRPTVMDEARIALALELLERPHETVTSIAKLIGVSRNTLYKHIPQLRAARPAALTGGTTDD